MKVSTNDLYVAAEWLDQNATRFADPADQTALLNAADWMRFVAAQREEYEARKRSGEPRYKSLKSAVTAVWRARGVG